MKKFIAFFIAVSMVFMTLSCGEKPEKDTEDGADNVVAFLMPHLENPFMNRLSDAVKKYAKDSGLDLINYVANNDAQKQSLQIREAIGEGVCAIILDPCSNDELKDAVAEAKAAGIPVVTLHENISTQSDCISFVGPDFTDGGTQAMAQAKKDLPDGGNIAVIYGYEGHSAQIAISAGYPIALSGESDKYPIVIEGYGDWTAEKAQALVSEWLSKGILIDAIVCNNDGMASGALEAVTAAGLAGQINIYGLDAQRNILDAIALGTVKATIYTDFDSEAKKSVEIVTEVLAGRSVENEYLQPMILITADNADEFSR